MTLLALERVTVRWERETPGQRERVPLREASLELDAGETLAIVGRGRSGRTTLLRVAAGITAPTTGKVLFDGAAVVNDRFLGRPGGIGFCHLRFLPSIGPRALDHVAVSLLVSGHAPKHADARAEKALQRVGAEDCSDLDPATLDFGELIRVSMARALVAQPRLLLVDDPAYGVDLAERDEVLTLLRSIAHDDGLGVLFTASSGTELAGVDRAATIDAGVLRGELTPSEATIHHLYRDEERA